MRYPFIQEGSTKDSGNVKSAIDPIERFLRIGREGESDRALIATYQEASTAMHPLNTSSPDYISMRLWPRDWHHRLHGGKVIKRQLWGAGIEFVAKALVTDNNKRVEGGATAGHSITLSFSKRV